MAETFTLGQSVVVAVAFRDPDGMLVDPAEVTFRVRSPVGLVTEMPPDRTGVGMFRFVFSPDEYGRWQVRARGVTAEWTPTEEMTFDVEPSPFGLP
jgi:uncharacterized protein YfaS (alpha-2-macroglobulin family)